MALGNILRKARESRKLSPSQVASATHMKMQTVEAIEQEDFSRMPAAIYCKGFIKLYAEYMGLDPDPLTREYVERFVTPPSLPEPEDPEDMPAAFHIGSSKKEDLPPIGMQQEENAPDLFSYGASRKESPPEKLFDHTPPERVEDIAPSSVGEGLSDIGSKFMGSLSKLTDRLKEGSGRIREALPKAKPEIVQPKDTNEKPVVDTSPITLPNRQILIVSGIAVGIVILVFLISVIARFFTEGHSTVLPDPSEQELVLPVEPPPPYID